MAEIINVTVNETSTSVNVQITGGFIIGSQVTQSTIEGVIGQAVVGSAGVTTNFNVLTGKTEVKLSDKPFTTAYKNKIDLITVSQAVNLDTIKLGLVAVDEKNTTQDSRLATAELKLANILKAVGVTMSYNNRVIASGGTVEGLDNLMEKYLEIIIL